MRGQIESDTFLNTGHTVKFYINKLSSIGCPPHLVDTIRELANGRHLDINETDGISTQRVKWDGIEISFFEEGEWGFHRVCCESLTGYVDFGYKEN